MASPLIAQAGPDSSPILRIELGAHVDYLNGTAIDPGGRWLLTASWDKTARLWEIASLSMSREKAVAELYSASQSYIAPWSCRTLDS
jgi:WD40 repeat protein